VGSSGSPGKGGGWGGGEGTGVGIQTGAGTGSFGSRTGGGRVLMVKRHGGNRATEGAVDLALRWLATHQESDGHWDAKKYGAEQKTDTACTGFALLAFLGAGHTEKVGTYKDNVQRAVGWLKSVQQANGLVFDESDAGGHRAKGYPGSIAGLALAEAAGMARVPDTVKAAQKAVDYSVKEHGSGAQGWRYGPKQAGDLSVSGWFIMQLKSAKVAGLYVDQSAFDDAIKFVDSVEQKDKGGPKAHGYSYQPGGKMVKECRTGAIGNLARLFLGWKPEDQKESVKYFVQKGGVPDEYSPRKTDLYYWYYGTLCTFQQGGECWTQWNEAMKRTLVSAQRKDEVDEKGSWDPVGQFAQEWGRVGQTALGALCLEVYYRYSPMYR
jgi:hypothetical protein